MNSRNIVLGLVSAYPLYFIKPFFTSLKKTGFDGETVIFVNEVSLEVTSYFKAHGIIFFEYELEWPYLKDERLKPFVRVCDRELSPNSMRYLLYEAYLKSNDEHIDRILIADVRDVYFQQDPFKFDYSPGISVFLEHVETTIGKQFHNSNWIREAFGNKVLDNLQDKPISCSGVTIGDYPGMILYFEKMLGLICTKKNIPGLDQGIHNYLLHTGQIENATVFHDDEGPVSTISFFKPKKSIRIRNGIVIGSKGQTVNIVHQFDRSDRLLLRWNLRYFIRHKFNIIKGVVYSSIYKKIFKLQ